MKCSVALTQLPKTPAPISVLLSCIFLFGFLFGGFGFTGTAYAQQTIAPAGKSDPNRATKSKAPFRKVLFLGNSITLHGPKKDIDWLDNWGMAASALENDYVHLVLRSLAKTTGTVPESMVKNIAEFEQQYATYDVEEKLKDALGYEADLVIVAIGENVPAMTSDQSKAQFKDGLMRLLRGLTANRHPTIVVRSSFWADATKDQILKQACEEAGGVFVDIGRLGKDEYNYARAERQFKHSGVAAHPGDKGMRAIADAILRAIGN
jgi:hypothetical protein